MRGFPVFAETLGGQAGVDTHGARARRAVQDGACTTPCARHGLSVGLAHTGLPTKLQHGSELGSSAAIGVLALCLREGVQLL